MRRGLGRGRLLIGIGAVLAIIGAFLPWTYAGGGDSGIPMITANAFDGAGVLTFLAAVGLVALLLLPYASTSGRSSLDRWLSFVLVGGLMVVGTIIGVIQILPSLKLTPVENVLGLWFGVIGTVLVVWGAAEILNDESAARASDAPRQMTSFRPRRKR